MESGLTCSRENKVILNIDKSSLQYYKWETELKRNETILTIAANLSYLNFAFKLDWFLHHLHTIFKV